MAACNSGNGYVVTGSVEGAADGDTIYLATVQGRQLANLDTTVISNGKFKFEGKQDTAVLRYVCYTPEGDQPQRTDFFLENGRINIQLAKDEKNNTIGGTANNDTYMALKQQNREASARMMEIREAVNDPSLTDEARQKLIDEYESIDEQLVNNMKAAATQNITNAVGIQMLKRTYYDMSIEEIEALIPQIPAEFAKDEQIVYIKEMTEKKKKTAEGQKFIDFTMKTPEGQEVKLSDYVGKGKVVLVDFWASWCGPCCREMPNLVEVYAQYKDKGFEIVGVSLDRDAESWKKAIQELNITWPQMSDLKFWKCEGAQLYAVNSIPHTVLIAADGTILARGLHGAEVAEKVAEALK